MPLYSRVQGLEADADAVGLLGEMGYEDSSGVFVALLETLYARYGDTV